MDSINPMKYRLKREVDGIVESRSLLEISVLIKEYHDKALALEEDIIAVAMLNNSLAAYVLQLIKPEHFGDMRTMWIYGAIKQVYERGEEIDLQTVARQLNNQGILKVVGGLDYLQKLIVDRR